MMKQLIFIFLSTIMSTGVMEVLEAQQIIASSGGTGQNTSGTITYTLGELVIETYSGADKKLTQGFQQTRLIVTDVNELPGLNYTISVFPNPVTSYVKLLLGKEYPENLEYLMIDMNGKVISTGKLNNNQTEVSFEALPCGIYFLKVIQDKKEVKTLKVVKQ